MRVTGVPASLTQRFVGVSVMILGLLLAWQMGSWLSQGSLTAVAYLGLGIVLIYVTWQIFRDWRSGLFLFFAWLLFEDLPRKYLGNQTALFFGKDFLVFITYLSFWGAVRSRREKLFRPPFFVFLALFFWLAAVQVFNPNTPSVLYGLLGLKLYFFYVPLVAIGYAFVKSDQDLRRFLVFSMVLGGLIAALGITQALVGLNFMNPSELAPEIRELSTLHKVTPITHEIVQLPNSVFVSSGRLDAYLVLLAVLGVGTVGYLLLVGKKGRRISLACLGIVAVGITLSGSRGTFVYSIASFLWLIPIMIWGAPWRWGQAHRIMKAVFQVSLIGTLALALAIAIYPEEIGKRWHYYSETLSPESPASELGYRSWGYPLMNLQMALADRHWLEGNGTGTCSLGVQYVNKLLGEQRPAIGVENGFGVLILEMGILGLVLLIATAGMLLFGVWKAVRRTRGTRFFPVGAAVAWFAFLLLFPWTYGGMSAYQNYVLNAYFWLFVGVVHRLPELVEAAVVARAPGSEGPAPNPSLNGLE